MYCVLQLDISPGEGMGPRRRLGRVRPTRSGHKLGMHVCSIVSMTTTNKKIASDTFPSFIPQTH